MSRALARTVRWIDAVNAGIARGVAWLLVAMVVLTCALVLLRYGFGIGATALGEAVVYMHAAVFLLSAAQVLNTDGHVRVDIFYRRWGARTRHWVNLLGSLFLLLPFALFLFATGLDYVAASWARWETSPEPDGLPFVYLLKTLILVAALQLAAASISRAVEATLALRGRA